MYTKLLFVNPQNPPKQGTIAASRRVAPGRPRRGFTLIELLVVMTVIVLMTTLAIPAFNALRGGTDFTSEVYEIAGLFDQARAYATANNTYVLAGIVEVSGAQDTTVSPQVSGTGRIAVALVASKSGMRPYQISTLSSWKTTGYNSGIALAAVSNLMPFQNIHLVDLQYNGTSPVTLPGSGGLARPAVGSYYYDLSNPNATYGTSSTWFGWPLGTTIGVNAKAQYTFLKVVEFDPQGSARFISTSNTPSYPDATPQYLEIGLQPSHGGAAAGPPAQSTNPGQIAAIQINGLTGAVHIYRP
jgi:prepilin-type N-terminal cleavage/methylation domain-containing protein